MDTPPLTQNTLIISGRKRETLRWASGMALLRQYDAAGQLIEETYSHGELQLIRCLQSGEYHEHYKLAGQLLSRRRYDAERQACPEMPAARGEPGAAEDDIVCIRYDGGGQRHEFHEWPDGSSQSQLFHPSGLRQQHERRHASGRREKEYLRIAEACLLRSEGYGDSLELLAIHSEFIRGQLRSQRYMAKGKSLTRAAYEDARQAFADMPAADTSVPDQQAELAAALKIGRAWARQEKRKAQRQHQPNAERARRHEAFCERLMADACEPAGAWIEKPRNTVSVKSRRASLAFIRKLYELGAVEVYACDIEDGLGTGDNSSHLVLQLPAEGPGRAALLEIACRISQQEGFDPVLDDGQRLQYMKLD